MYTPHFPVKGGRRRRQRCSSDEAKLQNMDEDDDDEAMSESPIYSDGEDSDEEDARPTLQPAQPVQLLQIPIQPQFAPVFLPVAAQPLAAVQPTEPDPQMLRLQDQLLLKKRKELWKYKRKKKKRKKSKTLPQNEGWVNPAAALLSPPTVQASPLSPTSSKPAEPQEEVPQLEIEADKTPSKYDEPPKIDVSVALEVSTALESKFSPRMIKLLSPNRSAAAKRLSFDKLIRRKQQNGVWEKYSGSSKPG